MASTFYSTTPMSHAFVEHQSSLSHNPAFFSQPTLNPALFVQTGYGVGNGNVSSPRLKRKRSSSTSGDESDDHSARASTNSRSPSPPSTSAPTPRHKKRRLGTIEHGLEHMSLQREQLPHLVLASSQQAFACEPIVEEPDDVDLTSHSYSYYGDIDEYLSQPPMREVKMHGTSWYEPEKDRIVITDLDGSDDETDSEALPEAHGEETLHISPAMLSALRRSRPSFRVPMANTTASQGDAAALVLYRPSPWCRTPSALPGEPDIEVLEDEYEAAPRIGSVGGDTMDIDMMDVEEL